MSNTGSITIARYKTSNYEAEALGVYVTGYPNTEIIISGEKDKFETPYASFQCDNDIVHELLPCPGAPDNTVNISWTGTSTGRLVAVTGNPHEKGKMIPLEERSGELRVRIDVPWGVFNIDKEMLTAAVMMTSIRGAALNEINKDIELRYYKNSDKTYTLSVIDSNDKNNEHVIAGRAKKSNRQRPTYSICTNSDVLKSEFQQAANGNDKFSLSVYKPGPYYFIPNTHRMLKSTPNPASAFVFSGMDCENEFFPMGQKENCKGVLDVIFELEVESAINAIADVADKMQENIVRNTV